MIAFVCCWWVAHVAAFCDCKKSLECDVAVADGCFAKGQSIQACIDIMKYCCSVCPEAVTVSMCQLCEQVTKNPTLSIDLVDLDRCLSDTISCLAESKVAVGQYDVDCLCEVKKAVHEAVVTQCPLSACRSVTDINFDEIVVDPAVHSVAQCTRQVLVKDGTVALPQYSFYSSPSTGLYYVDTDSSLDVAQGGQQFARMTTAAPLTFDPVASNRYMYFCCGDQTTYAKTVGVACGNVTTGTNTVTIGSGKMSGAGNMNIYVGPYDITAGAHNQEGGTFTSKICAGDVTATNGAVVREIRFGGGNMTSGTNQITNDVYFGNGDFTGGNADITNRLYLASGQVTATGTGNVSNRVYIGSGNVVNGGGAGSEVHEVLISTGAGVKTVNIGGQGTTVGTTTVNINTSTGEAGPITIGNATAAGCAVTINSKEAVNITTARNAGRAIYLTTSSGLTGSTIELHNPSGTANPEASGNGAIRLFAEAGGIMIESQQAAEGAIKLRATGSTTATIKLQSNGTGDNAITLDSTNGGVLVQGAKDSANAVRLYASGGGASTAVHIDSNGTGDAAINLTTSAGGMTLSAATGETITMTAGSTGIVRISAEAADSQSTVWIGSTNDAGNKSTLYISGDMPTGTGSTVYIDTAGNSFRWRRDASSRRYKENIVPLSDSTWIYNLEGKLFNFKTDPNIVCAGWIAEDVDLLNKTVVSYNGDGQPEALKYTQFLPFIVEELKKLKATVDAQQVEIAALKSRLEVA
jgi:hypothetical protein